jgi:hypothetical protein
METTRRLCDSVSTCDPITHRLLLESTAISIICEELDERVRNCSKRGSEIELADWVILRI